jgi:hypothetical protein
MSLLEILKIDVGGQEASKRIFDNFRPIIHFDVTKTQLVTVTLTQNGHPQFKPSMAAARQGAEI